jgi:hypothetical protein
MNLVGKGSHSLHPPPQTHMWVETRTTQRVGWYSTHLCHCESAGHRRRQRSVQLTVRRRAGCNGQNPGQSAPDPNSEHQRLGTRACSSQCTAHSEQEASRQTTTVPIHTVTLPQKHSAQGTVLMRNRPGHHAATCACSRHNTIAHGRMAADTTTGSPTRGLKRASHESMFIATC